MPDTRGLEHGEDAADGRAFAPRADEAPNLSPRVAMPEKRRFGISELLAHPSLAWLVLAAGVAVTAVAWAVADDMARRRVNDHFLFVSEQVVTAIDRRMDDYVFALRAGEGLFEWSDDVTRREWLGFHQTLGIERSFPGIEAYVYVRIIPAAEVAAHQTRMRAEGFPDYVIHPGRPGTEAGDSAVAEYVAPYTGRNLRVLGYDLSNDPVRREAMNRARDTGEPALSGKLTLVQETEAQRQNGVILFLPIYRRGMPVDTVEGRREALRGFVAGAFRMGDLMRGVLGADLNGIRFEIFDGRTASAESSLIRQDGLDVGDDVAPLREGSGPLRLEWLIEIAGRPWNLRMEAGPGFAESRRSDMPLVVALGGGLLDLTLFALVLAITRRHKRAVELAREMTRDLSEARAAAERASVAKSSFLTRMSHEFRTPLNAILGFSDMMLEGTLGPVRPEKYQCYIRRIHGSGEHLLSLVTQLLDLSAIEAGRHQLHPEWLDLEEVMAEAVEMVSPLAETAGQTLNVAVLPDTPAVWADRRSVRQVMVNLIGNGIKFTPAGGAITVRVGPEAPAVPFADGGVSSSGGFFGGRSGGGRSGGGADAVPMPPMVVISVADTGRGISPEELPRVLEPFVTTAGADGVAGTGLGLPISKALVEAQGGGFRVESAVGVGTTVVFTLPVAVGA